PGTHSVFEATTETGSFCWAEVFTREPEKADAFFPGVFGYEVKTMQDDQIDYRIYGLGEDTPELGRMKMTDEEFPPEVPPYIQVYFTVPDCDAAAATAQKLGGRVVFGPMSMPFGRFASLVDPQGAAFAVIDVTTTEGEMPTLV
ncbi:VOC family protein, partial [Streptomyces sp. NPDC127084]|uniref:VOC family protein n=1 Tax=Streptomyces sp. NPDC127084 TaxID=3347133 RepID=UPI00365153F0